MRQEKPYVDKLGLSTVIAKIKAMTWQAVKIIFAPGNSGLVSTNVQAALLELKGQIDRVSNGVFPKGTVAFANLPTLADAGLGDMYNISDSFTTDANFYKSGVSCGAGTNIYCASIDGVKKWDVFAVTPSIVVDQQYDAASSNAQSGTAVADALASLSFAGAASQGGAATSANKLNTNAGATNKPVYFTGGVPAACAYEVNKSVPADAKFTDTTAGTSYNAGQCPDNTTFATQGSVARAYADAKNRPVLLTTPNLVEGGLWIG